MVLKDKTKNQVNVIYPYRGEYGVWAFDDPEVDLDGEPFVGPINQMIDMLTQGGSRCTAYISKSPLPQADAVLEKVEPERDMPWTSEGWYKLQGTEVVGWLCPALLKYFDGYPEEIYVKIDNVA